MKLICHFLFLEMKQVIGVIESFKKIKSDFILNLRVNGGDNIEVTYSSNYFLICNEDKIYCRVNDGKIESRPFVLTGDTPLAIQDSIRKILRVNTYKAASCQSMYSNGDLNEYLSLLAENLCFYGIENTTPILNLNLSDTNILLKGWYKERNLRALYLLGLNGETIATSKLGPLILFKKILENPLKLFYIKTEIACDIIISLNLKFENKDIYAGFIGREIYNGMCNKSWSYTPVPFIKQIKDIDDKTLEEYSMVKRFNGIFLKEVDDIEEYIANFLISFSRKEGVEVKDITYTGLKLSPDQIEAVTGCLNNPISLISGMAGSGKTTIIKEIINNLECNGIEYLLCSFTGKAVSRIREKVGRNASTIHLFLSLV